MFSYWLNPAQRPEAPADNTPVGPSSGQQWFTEHPTIHVVNI